MYPPIKFALTSRALLFYSHSQLCQLAEFYEIKGFKISLYEDHKRLLRIQLPEGKVCNLYFTTTRLSMTATFKHDNLILVGRYL